MFIKENFPILKLEAFEPINRIPSPRPLFAHNERMYYYKLLVKIKYDDSVMIQQLQRNMHQLK